MSPPPCTPPETIITACGHQAFAQYGERWVILLVHPGEVEPIVLPYRSQTAADRTAAIYRGMGYPVCDVLPAAPLALPSEPAWVKRVPSRSGPMRSDRAPDAGFGFDNKPLTL